MRFRLALNVGSEKGFREANRFSSQGRSNFISVTVRWQGKLAKKEKAQSRRVIIFINLLCVSY